MLSRLPLSTSADSTVLSDLELTLALRLRAHTPQLASECSAAFAQAESRAARRRNWLMLSGTSVLAVAFGLVMFGIDLDTLDLVVASIGPLLVAMTLFRAGVNVTPDTRDKPISPWAMGELTRACARVPLVEAVMREWLECGAAITDSEYWLLTNAVKFAEQHGIGRTLPARGSVNGGIKKRNAERNMPDGCEAGESRSTR